MDERHKKLLTKNRLALVRGMVVDEDLLAYLMAMSTLTDSMKDEIDVKQTKRDKNGALLDLLPRRGPHAFRAFIEGLVETGQGHLGDMLDGNIANEYRTQNGLPAGDSYPQSVPTRPPPRSATAAPANLEVPLAEVLQEDSIFPNVNKLRNSDPELIKKVIEDEERYYKIGRKVRGRCIIINVDRFSKESGKKDREGSYTDVTNLTEVFKKLHFEVVLWDNFSADEIKASIKKERKSEALRDTDAFAMAVLSHGMNDLVFGIDGGKVSITNDIVQQFNGLKCGALIGKPKIFFIQACQGSGVSTGVVPDDAGDARTEADDDHELPPPEAVHEEADILVVTGTVPGYKAWRNIIKGSWFITDLTVALVQNAHYLHLQDIITIVTRKVDARARDNTGHKQICQTRGQLRRNLYFLPGYIR